MRIALFNWRDIGHPQAGGAEFATDRLAAGLSRRGHDVTWFTSTCPQTAESERRNGYTVVRRGSPLTCRFFAANWLRERRDAFDVVIDEVNTLPFFSPLVFRGPVILWIHQLAREIWFAEAPALLALPGYLLEPLFLSIYARTPVVTVSQSSAASLQSFGFRGPVEVVENALAPPHTARSSPVVGHIGFVGRAAPSKRIDHIIRALALVRRTLPEARLSIVGAGHEKEIDRLKTLAARHGVADHVRFHGKVSRETRDDLMATFDVLAMASLREGWGLVVSEAARFEVPSAVYPVAGLTDSVRNEQTGLIARHQTPEALAVSLIRLIGDRALRSRLGAGAAAMLREYPEERFIARSEAFLERAVREKTSN